MMPQFTAEIARMLSPLFLLAAAGCVFIVLGAIKKGVSRAQEALIVLFHIAVLACIAMLWNVPGYPILNGMLIVDRFALFFMGICTVCSLCTVFLSSGYLNRFGIDRSEYYAMLFFSLAGMFVLVTANNLMTIFLGIELMSMAVYIMVAFRRRDFFSNEAALKYFLLGAFAIAFFLYGMALVYGLCGTLNLRGIMRAAVDGELYRTLPFLFAIGLIMIGFVFKVSAVPFHMWVPDVYQGAPTPVTAFMASAVKAASFAAFLRLFYVSFMAGRAHWAGIFAVLAILTMTTGNIVALVQRNVKRMLAYSSIAHAGYIMVAMSALAIDNTVAASAVMYYLLSYAVMTLGAFAMVTAMERRSGTRGLELEDYAGLGLRYPFLGLAMTVFMLSMAGIPPFAGFIAKVNVFSAAMSKGMVSLVVVAVLNSVLSLYYYLRVIVFMYFRKAHSDVPVKVDMGVRIVLVFSLIAVFWLGMGPSGWIPGVDSILQWTHDSLAQLVAVN